MRTVTYAAIADVDAIKTTVSALTDPVEYDGEDLNGVVGAGTMRPARTVSVTTASETAAYDTTEPILIEGFDPNGNAISEEILLTAANGGETVVGAKAFRNVTKISIPAQPETDGAFTFGVADIMCSTPPTEVRCGAATTLHVQYDDGSEDTITDLVAGERIPISPSKIFVSGTTATKLTLLF